MPTFLQLYRLLSIYKLIKPPKFGNCGVDEFDSRMKPAITFDDFKRIFSENEPSESAIQKLKLQLDSLVEQEDWDDEELISEEYDGSGESELTDMILYSATGYLCRRLLKFTKCETCREALLTKLSSSDIAVAELVNLKTRGFLLHSNLYLFKLFRQTETFFAINVQFSNCYEKTLNDVFDNCNLTFPCDEHKSEVLSMGLHYYIVMRMRQYEREQNRRYKKRSQMKKKEAKLCPT